MYNFIFLCYRPDDLCDLQSLNANSSLPPTSSQSISQTTTSPGNTLTCTEELHESTTAPRQNPPHSNTLPTKTTLLAPQSIPRSPSPPRQNTLNCTPPESTLQTTPPPPLHTPLTAPVTPQIFSQSPPATSHNPTHSPSQSPPNVTRNITQNSSRWPHRTLQNVSQSLSDSQLDLFKSPPTFPHNISHNASELLSVSAQHPAKAPASPPLSPSHCDPFLLSSVTFTSSVSSSLYSPVCSSSASFLGSLDSLPPSIGLLPTMSSTTPQLITPPPTLTPPPRELTPPPVQLLGSDDEEQEDPSDYCKGESSFPDSSKNREGKLID